MAPIFAHLMPFLVRILVVVELNTFSKRWSLDQSILERTQSHTHHGMDQSIPERKTQHDTSHSMGQYILERIHTNTHACHGPVYSRKNTHTHTHTHTDVMAWTSPF